MRKYMVAFAPKSGDQQFVGMYYDNIPDAVKGMQERRRTHHGILYSQDSLAVWRPLALKVVETRVEEEDDA